MTNKMNLGCGFDVKEGWTNVDRILGDGIENWEMIKDPVPEKWVGKFDTILVNHVLCMVPFNDLVPVLEKIRVMLKENGQLIIIDMDVDKAINDYKNNDSKGLPIQEGTPSWNLCMHLSGYSTRPSLFTPSVILKMLDSAGYDEAWNARVSEHDTRPSESLVVEAIK